MSGSVNVVAQVASSIISLFDSLDWVIFVRLSHDWLHESKCLTVLIITIAEVEVSLQTFLRIKLSTM